MQPAPTSQLEASLGLWVDNPAQVARTLREIQHSSGHPAEVLGLVLVSIWEFEKITSRPLSSATKLLEIIDRAAKNTSSTAMRGTEKLQEAVTALYEQDHGG